MTRGPYRRNHACVDCGAPTGRPGSRCPACRREHELARKRAYARRRGHPERQTPAPVPQDDPALPPLGMMVTDDDGATIQCHVCGAFRASLVTHIRTHGLDTRTYRERFQLARKTPLVAPVVSAKLRASALAHDQVALLTPRPKGHPGRTRGEANRLQSRIAVSDGRQDGKRPDDR